MKEPSSVLETKLITCCKEEVILFLKSHPEYFEETIELALSDKQPYSWRAAFSLWACMEENDKRVQKHMGSIISAIKTKKDGHQRELLKILYRMKLKEKYESVVFDTCLGLWQQIDKNPSVRITSLKFIIRIVKKYPDLLKEISYITQEHYLNSLSPGVKKSAGKMLREIM